MHHKIKSRSNPFSAAALAFFSLVSEAKHKSLLCPPFPFPPFPSVLQRHFSSSRPSRFFDFRAWFGSFLVEVTAFFAPL